MTHVCHVVTLRHSTTIWCNIMIRFTAVGTLPLEVHLASLGVGNYRLSVLATDTFNLTDESFVTFSGKYRHSISQLLCRCGKP